MLKINPRNKKFRLSPGHGLTLLAVILCLFFQPACTSVNRDAETQIVILHVNDLHAKIDQFPKIAAYIAQQRAEHENVFVLNGGDNFSGNPVVDLANPQGEPVRQLLNMMTIDVLTIGNHDFDYGQAVLKGFIEKANFRFLCLNADMKKSGLPQPNPFVFLETKNRIKIALVGMVQVEADNHIPSTKPGGLNGISFSEPIEATQKYRYLKKESDIFIALSHLGFDDDIILADKMPELDLIIGGHSHTAIEEPVEHNGVLITQAGAQGAYVGRIVLTVKDRKIINKSARLVDVKSLKTGNPEMQKLVDAFNDNPVLEEEVGTLSISPQGKFELGHLITDGIRSVHKADIAFHNSGGIRSGYLPRIVLNKDVYTLHPFGNEVVLMKMSAEEIRSLLKYDYEKQKKLDLKVSGLHYTITRSPDFKVISMELSTPGGKLLEEDRDYTVALNNYIFSTYGFRHKDPGTSIQTTLAETLTQYIKEGNAAAKDICADIQHMRTFETIAADATLTEIGKLEIPLSGSLSPRSSSAGNLAADAVRVETGADIVLLPDSMVRAELVLKAPGPYYSEYTPALYAFSDKNTVVTAGLSGKQLEEFLRQRNKYRMDFQVSGMTYRLVYDTSGQLAELQVTLPGGGGLEADKVYKAAFTDYDYKKHYKLEGIAPSFSEKTVAQMVNDYVKKIGNITVALQEERVTVDYRKEK